MSACAYTCVPRGVWKADCQPLRSPGCFQFLEYVEVFPPLGLCIVVPPSGNSAESHSQPQPRKRTLYSDLKPLLPASCVGGRYRKKRLDPEPNLGKGGKL